MSSPRHSCEPQQKSHPHGAIHPTSVESTKGQATEKQLTELLAECNTREPHTSIEAERVARITGTQKSLSPLFQKYNIENPQWTVTKDPKKHLYTNIAINGRTIQVSIRPDTVLGIYVHDITGTDKSKHRALLLSGKWEPGDAPLVRIDTIDSALQVILKTPIGVSLDSQKPTFQPKTRSERHAIRKSQLVDLLKNQFSLDVTWKDDIPGQSNPFVYKDKTYMLQINDLGNAVQISKKIGSIYGNFYMGSWIAGPGSWIAGPMLHGILSEEITVRDRIRISK